MRRQIPLALVLLSFPWALTACDNPACVFAPNGCQNLGDGESIGSQPASVPTDGAWILPAEPTVQSMAPAGTQAHPGTPIAITFSESLNPDSLNGAFEVMETSLGTPMPFLDPPPLAGDGRMVILVPLTSLQLGATYQVSFSEEGAPTDLTGQLVSQGVSPNIGSFTVAETTPEIPDVIATYPADFATGQSDISTVVVVFDREMDEDSFDLDSWAVTVDGSPPADNPAPVALSIGGGPVSVTIDSVWRWASVDGSLRRTSLGAGGAVEVELSPPGEKLEDTDGNELPATVFEFDLASFGTPDIVEKGTLSDPQDAIGRPNLNGAVPVLQAQTLTNAQANDVLDLYLFGQGTDGDGLVALGRSVSVTSTTMLIDVMPADLKLLNAGAGVLLDGNMSVGASLRRGGTRTALRMLDIDPDAFGAQPILYDVTAPNLTGLGTSGQVTSSFASDVRDMVVVGRANEAIRRVEVSSSTGDDNGLEPGVIMAAGNGLFVAKPATIGSGVLDPATAPTYTVQVYDRALNPQSSAVMGTFNQRGAVVGVAPEGGTVDVYVYNAATLAPVQGALVMVHQDASGVFTPVPSGSGTTDASGHVNVPAAGVGNETIVTVDHSSFGLWTLHGVPTDALSVPLVPNGMADASTEGEVQSPLPDINLTTFSNSILDSRRPDGLSTLIDVQSCGVDSGAGNYACPFGPDAIYAAQLGAQVFFSGDFSQNLGSFTPSGFLRAFTARFPTSPLTSGGAESDVFLFVDEFLAFGDSEGQPIEMPAQGLDIPGNFAPNLGTLDGDPVVTVEALSAGLVQGMPVGLGMAFDTGGGPGPWTIRGAYPGVADGIDNGGGDVLGELVTDGTIEADLFVRVEVADTAGNLVGARPRFSHEDSILDPPDVPVFQVPGPGGSTGGSAYNLQCADVIPDSFGMEGLYRFEVREATGSGRAWTIWRPDPPGSGTVLARVPDVTDFSSTGLADGGMTCRISAFAWEDLDLTEFLWSDVGREQEVFAHTFVISFTQD